MVPQSRIYSRVLDAAPCTPPFVWTQLARQSANPIASQTRNVLQVDATELVIFVLPEAWSRLIRIVYSAHTRHAASHACRHVGTSAASSRTSNDRPESLSGCG